MPVRQSSTLVTFLTILATAIFATAIPCSLQAQRNLTDIPEPDTTAEQQAMQVDDAAALNLFASDPDISKPIQMNFDSTGGLWVASSEVYPQIKPGEIANDKIIVLRDTTGDGIADKRTVFADGLLIPTGVAPDSPHSAYVVDSTRLLYLEDTDGDGKADKKRVVLSGFGTEDTHHLVHTLRIGPDGCLYFNQSIYIHSHVITPYGTRHLDGGGIWRYRPTTGQLEVFSKGLVNAWGHVFNAQGESFATDGAGSGGLNYVFPDSVFVTSPGAKRWLNGLNPGSPKHCGLEILSGTHVPPEWVGDFVTNDFRSHRVCRFTTQPNGSSYISRQQPEIITTQRVSFRPIDAAMGPDGALYIADWYNPIIQHGEVDFRDERRDRTHGRIWRVSFPEREADPWPEFATENVDGLLKLLRDPALPVRQFAREELWKRADQDQAKVLKAYREWTAKDPGNRALELFWFHEVLGMPIGDQLLAMFDVADPASWRTMLRSVWRSRLNESPETPNAALSQPLADLLNRILVERNDPRLLLEAVVCAGQLDASISPQALSTVLQASQQTSDPSLEFAIWQSLRSLDASYPEQSILASRKDWGGSLNELASAITAIANPKAAEIAVGLIETSDLKEQTLNQLIAAVAVAGDADQLGRTFRAMVKRHPAAMTMARVKPLLDRTQRDRTIPTNVGQALIEFFTQTGSNLQNERLQVVAKIANVWKVNELESALLTALATTQGPAQQKIIDTLAAYDSQQVRKTLAELAKSPESGKRVAAVRAIAARRPRAAIPMILKLLQDNETSRAASAMVVSMLSRKDLPPVLAEAIQNTKLPTDVARSLLRDVRVSGGQADLEKAIRSAGQLEQAKWKLTPELQTALIAEMKSNGSATRGEQIYRRKSLQCIICHAIGNAGGLVGPNLISLGGSSQPDYIVEALLDPSAKLKEGFTTLTVLTDEGEIINGISLGKNGDGLRLRLADGKEVQIDLDSIEQTKPGKSLMPEGLLDSLPQQELVDLLTFMSALGREPDYKVSTEPIVRSLETLNYTNAANSRLNRTSMDTAASNDTNMTWRSQTTKVDGTIPLSELDQFKQHRTLPHTSFVRFGITMPREGIAEIDIPADGISAWIDGKPTPTTTLGTLPLDSGDHVVVLAINRVMLREPFAIKVDGDAVISK
ncbi:L-sorbosone dehydrogenase [Rubripirellula sp.]|nr:PVC-type heme-binding CxxCH protein [Rubripirellula sp.]MDB4644782.1 L-sorbosone dehydrogenase [Rubripirellula sp.]